MIDNIWIQGDTNYGTTGIRIGETSSYNHIVNVISELTKTGANYQTVHLEPGTTGNRIIDVYNRYENGTTAVSVRDNSGNRNNVITHSFYVGISIPIIWLEFFKLD